LRLALSRSPHAPYIVRRGNALAFRRRVPKGHAGFFRSAFLQTGLGTHLLAERRRRVLRATAFTSAAFAMLEACEGGEAFSDDYEKHGRVLCSAFRCYLRLALELGILSREANTVRPAFRELPSTRCSR
jgi:hypothetical protein